MSETGPVRKETVKEIGTTGNRSKCALFCEFHPFQAASFIYARLADLQDGSAGAEYTPVIVSRRLGDTYYCDFLYALVSASLSHALVQNQHAYCYHINFKWLTSILHVLCYFQYASILCMLVYMVFVHTARGLCFLLPALITGEAYAKKVSSKGKIYWRWQATKAPKQAFLRGSPQCFPQRASLRRRGAERQGVRGCGKAAKSKRNEPGCASVSHSQNDEAHLCAPIQRASFSPCIAV